MRFKYPPCKINPETDLPYTRHKWIIPTREVDGRKIPKVRPTYNGTLVYHVICERCRIRDPKPPEY